MKKSISGIRGVFGEDLTLNHVIEFTNSFAHLIKSGRCVIARDTRPSGPMIEEVATSSLLQNGIDVFTLGTAPTPVVFRESRRFGAGIVVTSSHNPLEWNGLKFIVEGRGIGQEQLSTIVTRQETRLGAVGEQSHIESRYVEQALSCIGEIPGRPEIALDLGGGAAAEAAPRLFERLGCRVRAINRSVADSSRGPDPTCDGLDDLARLSAESDIGFAFDLDGDRLVVAKDGARQTPDATLGLGIAKSLELGHRKFVLSIDTSMAVEGLIRERGGRVSRSGVGEANVVDAILKTGADAGGEGSSGGFILPEFNYCRDGILASGMIASMQDDQITEVLEIMGRYHQLRDKVAVKSALHDRLVGELTRQMQTEFSETTTIDGIRGTVDERSWVLVRKSNTEDAVRISAESDSLERAGRIMEKAKKLVGQCHDRVG